MKWMSVNTRKPRLGQKCYCYFVMERSDGSYLLDLAYRFELPNFILMVPLKPGRAHIPADSFFRRPFQPPCNNTRPGF